ncbi:MAG: tetratricopeptide repeat protein [Bacteroidales bacterium]|nr:tetratricopeptide repeat protein [Bacteroidales bacterium]
MKLTVILFLVSVIMGINASAQNSRPGSEAENMVISAVSRMNANDIEGARGILSSVLSQDPENDAAWYYMAVTSLMRNEVPEAEECLKAAISIDPGNFWYRYRLAGIYGATQRKELTADMYEKLLEDFPKRSELYIDMMELYAAQGDYEKALETIAQVETVFGLTESAAMYRFNLLRTLGRHEEAYASLEKYNEEYSSPYVLTTLADWQMSMYNDSTALGYYDEALDLAPDYTPAILGKAETYRLTRRYDEYFKELDGFVSMEDIPAQAKSEYLLAIVQRTDPKFIRSFESQIDSVILQAVGRHPQDSTMLHTAGVYYYSTDRNDEARKYFGRNVEAWPESLSASASFVEFLMYAGEWESLSMEGRKAFSRFPKETAFLEMASVGDYNLKKYDDVLDICRKVLETAPNDSSSTLRAWSTMGDIYHTLGDAKKSYKAYDKALKINPDYVYVLNNYAYYLSMEGKSLKKAYSMSKKTIEAEPNNSTYLDTFGWILYLQGKPDQAKPYFKQAMLYGGKESPVILDHYAEVLYALKEYDMAFVYWNLARQKNAGDIPDLDERIEVRRKAANR